VARVELGNEVGYEESEGRMWLKRQQVDRNLIKSPFSGPCLQLKIVGIRRLVVQIQAIERVGRSHVAQTAAG